jgi:cytochrome c peroxidase
VAVGVGRFSVYPQGITAETVADAIALYERTLVTPDAPFDRYLRGDETAITTQEKQGYQLFTDLGCVSCHQGKNVGGGLFQKIGIYVNQKQVEQMGGGDLGRFEVTHSTSDRFYFKVPSLRNVARTAPYFHNGAYATLEEAVEVMGEVQLGKKLSKGEVVSLVAFLQTLNGKLVGVGQ